MNLSDYLAPRGRLSALAASMERPVSTVHDWKSRRRNPSLRDAAAIERATGGEVTAAEIVAEFTAEPAKVPA